MEQIKFLETVMYAISEASTDELRDFLMLYEADDLDIDALQDNARHIWEKIMPYHEGFALIFHEKVDATFSGIIDGTEELER